ncbi:hypothetical protein NERG_01531 [Nematocida ausubeli]|uniref:Uncharacterized protein n=1 Tax=Nematocida ausubeli (strain ATCC PRA-371 / ERTm2) TaxID=1913371 RepID=H8ZD60_NEMA1|nr:hypothetical protein NERG_01531 [Nematocida ausubeli]
MKMKIFPINAVQSINPETLEKVLDTTEEVIIFDKIYKRYQMRIDEPAEVFIEEGETNQFLTFMKDLGVIG